MARRSLSPCAKPGCPELTRKSLCPIHERERRSKEDARRGSAAKRGYGYRHQTRRRQAAKQVATGTVRCWRCGDLIDPDEPWDLGHDDTDRTVYRGPEHRACNRATAGRKEPT